MISASQPASQPYWRSRTLNRVEKKKIQLNQPKGKLLHFFHNLCKIMFVASKRGFFSKICTLFCSVRFKNKSALFIRTLILNVVIFLGTVDVIPIEGSQWWHVVTFTRSCQNNLDFLSRPLCHQSVEESECCAFFSKVLQSDLFQFNPCMFC